MASYILGSSSISNSFRKHYLKFLYSKYRHYSTEVENAAFTIANAKAEIEDRILSNMKEDISPVSNWYSLEKKRKVKS